MSIAVDEERKKSGSTISDAELVASELDLDEMSSAESLTASRSRSSSRSSHGSRRNQAVIDDFYAHYEVSEVEQSDVETDPDAHLKIKPVQLSEEEFDAIYTAETRARAMTLLIYFSIILVAVPFASMYICYNYLLTMYSSNDAMLYAGILAIGEVYVIVVMFIYVAYMDEARFEKELKKMSKKTD